MSGDRWREIVRRLLRKHRGAKSFEQETHVLGGGVPSHPEPLVPHLRDGLGLFRDLDGMRTGTEHLLTTGLPREDVFTLDAKTRSP